MINGVEFLTDRMAVKKRKNAGPAATTAAAAKKAATAVEVEEQEQGALPAATTPPVRKALLRASRIFQPFRALGCITTDVPFAMQTRGGVHFVTTCTGNSFQIFDVRLTTVHASLVNLCV